MNEVRQNKVTKEWVIYAGARGKRPSDFQTPASKPKVLPVFDPACPFCPGNEAMLPSILLEMPGLPPGGWQTRVIPNKFPALSPEGDTARFVEGIYLAMKGFGRHEVIIENPAHGRQMARMSEEEVGRIIETYHRRFVDMMKDSRTMMPVLFRNHGPGAGTSLLHPHSQIIATGFVPHYIRWREEEAQRYFDEWGRCAYCDILEFERKDRRRVLLENGSFLAFVPYAAEVPFEIWIVPKAHQGSFGNISDREKSDLAPALQSLLARLYGKLNDPDYNYVIHSSAWYKGEQPHLHWSLQIRPRLTTQAGFEIGSGIHIHPSLPEEDAALLRTDYPISKVGEP
jgi:UDPglucose--hexose-1-phosphate uridylyltransferase